MPPGVRGSWRPEPPVSVPSVGHARPSTRAWSLVLPTPGRHLPQPSTFPRHHEGPGAARMRVGFTGASVFTGCMVASVDTHKAAPHGVGHGEGVRLLRLVSSGRCQPCMEPGSRPRQVPERRSQTSGVTGDTTSAVIEPRGLREAFPAPGARPTYYKDGLHPPEPQSRGPAPSADATGAVSDASAWWLEATWLQPCPPRGTAPRGAGAGRGRGREGAGALKREADSAIERLPGEGSPATRRASPQEPSGGRS